MESAGCETAQVYPDWAALGEWPKGAAHLVPCTSETTHTGGINTVGGIADKTLFIAALERMYTDHAYRMLMAKRAYDLVRRPEFTWDSVANRFDVALRGLITDG
jgi:hypothetical protein